MSGRKKRKGPCQEDISLTAERIDELLKFLPVFENPSRELVDVVGWQESPDGSYTMPYAIYDDEVDSFFEKAHQLWWRDYDYTKKDVNRMLDDDEFIAQASLSDLKTMITWCARGERFCDGLWKAVMDDGTIVKLLKRLEILRRNLD